MTAGATVATVDRRFLRPGWLIGHLLVVAAFLVCCRLGIWQWHRTRDADGTLQNLAYAILWPCFGIAFIYMWIRFLILEKAKDAADDQEMDEGLAAILADGAGTLTDIGADDRAVSGLQVADVSTGFAGRDAPVDADPTAVDEPDDSEQYGGEQYGGERYGGEPDDDESAEPGVFIGTVEDVDDEDDPELAAYNRALAALAERDERRGS